jgi:uncharacterized membrane protein YqjE
MIEESSHGPGIAEIAGRLGRTAAGLLHNRGELFVLEWQEEKARFLESILLSLAVLILGMLGIFMITATIVLLFAPEKRVYAAGVFALLYLAGAIVLFLNLKGKLKEQPFSESVAQLKKDSAWLDSLR